MPNDEFIVIGSRDFLNKIPAEEVARSVKQGFYDNKNLDQIAAELIHKAQSSSKLQQRDYLDDMSVVIITVGDEKLLKTRWSEGKGSYTIVPVNPDFCLHEYYLEDATNSSSDQHSTFKKVAFATGLGLGGIALGDTVSDKKIWKRIKKWFKKKE